MENLIKSLRDKGIYISYVEDNLKINFDGDQIPQDILNELKLNKQKLIDHLKLIGNNDYSAIPKISDNQKKYKVSSAQNRLWIVSQLKKASVAYNMPFSAALPKEYSDKELLNKSIRYVIERHESLRTIFKVEEDGEVYQVILSPEEVKFEIDYRDYKAFENKDQMLTDYISRDSLIPFDLENGPLFRICFFEMSDSSYHLYYNLHHIITDEWSMEVLRKDIFSCYDAFMQNKTLQLPKLKIQYKDYAAWQLDYLKSEELEESKLFWKDQLVDDIQLQGLPTHKIRPKTKTYNGKRLNTYLDQKTTKLVKDFTKKNGGSLFMVLMSSFKILLYKYSGQKDILIGSPIAGRDHADLENQIGFYLNTIVLRNTIDPDTGFNEFYNQVKSNLLNAFTHQSYPFDRLLEDLNLKRDLSRNAIFDILLDYHKSFDVEISDNLAQEISDFGQRPVKYDLELHFTEFENNLGITIDYNTDIYEEDIIRQFIRHYKNFINSSMIGADTSIGASKLLNDLEEEELLKLFNATEVNYPKQETILDLFRQQASSFPKEIAVADSNSSYTYYELETLSNKFAQCLLQNYKLSKGDYVGLKMEHGKGLVVAILGILKSGCVFVPIDPKYTSEREKYIIEDAAIKLIVTTTEHMFDFIESDLPLLSFDVEFEPEDFDSDNISEPISRESLAYIIYTSGSTGQPKGVMVEHGSLYNYINWCNSKYMNYELQNYNFGLFTSICFDLTITSLFLPLISGGILHILDSSKDVAQNLKEYLSKEVSCIKLTPAHINILESLDVKEASLELAIVGGDVLTQGQVEILKKINPKIRIFNEYGPTEATVGCIVKEIEDTDEQILIGKPIANTEVYILGDSLELLPKEVIGEIYIGGKGLAKGYVNKSELTKEKFVKNPFKDGEILYKTGDLGAWCTDGNIGFKGRKDDQVKIKGFRVELGEIEYHLGQHLNIQQAIVLVNEKSHEKHLEAYLIADKELNVKDIRNFLNQKLPEYMVPLVYNQLEEFPLTHNGKVDKKSLRNINNKINVSEEDFIEPATPWEKEIAAIWSEEFGIDKISVDASFFDLGGDSIRAIRVLSKMNKKLETTFELADIFENTTIKSLLNGTSTTEKLYTDELKEKVLEGINGLKKSIEIDQNIEDVYPMSDIEIGMCYSYTLGLGKGVYHDQFVYPMPTTSFNEKVFRKALDLIISKHDVLRTSFDLTTYEKPIRIIHKNIDCDLTFEDISMHDETFQKKHIESYMQNERYNVPFQSNKPGIWKMKIHKLEKDKHFLVFQFHHAILDGWSRASLITELNNTYFELEKDSTYIPKEITLNYKDYVIEQECLKQSNKVDEFWGNYLKDYAQLSLFTNETAHEETFQVIKGEQYEALKKICAENDLSVRNVVHAAYIFVLSKLTLCDDIITGVVTNGRPLDEEGDKLLGCFLNTIPFRTVYEEGTILAYLKDITRDLNGLKRYENLSLATLDQRYSQETNGENPFFDTLFSYIDFHIYKEANNYENANDLSFYIDHFEMTNTYLDVLALPNDNSITIQWIRNKELKSGKTNEDLSRIHLQFINSFIENSDQQLSTLNILESSEQVKLNEEFINTKTNLQEESHFITAFLNQVKETPNDIALVYNGNEWSYQSLDITSNKLADCLIKEKELKIGELVGIKLDASPFMILSILAIFKAGAAYVPLSTNIPINREEDILNDSQLRLIITDTDKIFELSYFEGDLFAVDVEFDEVLYSQNFTHQITNQSQLAYVIYTSGSTGKPKGTLIEHKSLINYLNWAKKTYVLPHETTDFGLFTPLSFDLTVTSIFLPLMSGGKLHIYSDTIDIGINLNSYMLDKIPVIKLTPAHIQLLSELNIINTDLQVAIVGGDALHNNHVKILKEMAPNVTVYNEYGPTETTVGCIAGMVDSVNNITIGKPIDNTYVYILNKFNMMQSIGIPGEICIGGFGLARAYLNNSELTDAKFIEHPFIIGEKMYKTGDIGRWLNNGEIEYIGRNDDQVKIRGYRIEPKDVQSHLIDKDDIDAAAVVVNSLEKENELIAFIVSELEHESKELRDYLKKRIPDYMIPKRFVQTSSIPLTNNGKIDKKKLLSMDLSEIATGVTYQAPKDEIEKQLVSIWERILQKEKIGMNDDYFLLGGNSLLAIRLVNEYFKCFNTKIALSDLFINSTIIGHKKLLSNITASNDENEMSLEKETLEF